MTTLLNGAVLRERRYYAYGNKRSGSDFAFEQEYTGQRLDNTGLLYYNARYYDPQLGLFISPDPLIPDPTNVLDYNRYAYGRGNPVSNHDPSGYATQAFDRYLHTVDSGGPDLSWIDEARKYLGDGYTLSDVIEGRRQYISYMQNPFLYAVDKEFEVSDPDATRRLAVATAYVENIEHQLLGPSVYGLEELRWESAMAELFQAGPAAAMAVFGGAPIWSATTKLTPVQNAYKHWSDHGADFPQYQNALQYVTGAHDFVTNPPPTAHTRVRSWNGDTVIYDPVSDIFAVRASNGAPRTMYRPDPAYHGYSTNLDYFHNTP